VKSCVLNGLHADAAFRANLGATRPKLAAARTRGVKPLRYCAAEAAAMTRQTLKTCARALPV